MKQNPKVLGKVFQTPVEIQGASWLPVTQVIVWWLFTRAGIRRNPDQSVSRAAGKGFLHMILLLGMEWIHNFAHALAAWLVGKPMDRIRIQLGMPRCCYHELNPEDVSPDQHVIRALGGPIANAVLLGLSVIWRRNQTSDSAAYRAAATAVRANGFLASVSLLPIPGIDGGPILKWSLVKNGSSPAEADEIVRKVNGPLAVILAVISALSLKRSRYWMGGFSGMLALTSMLIFTGVIREEEINL